MTGMTPKEVSEKWRFMMSWCKEKGVPPARRSEWMKAEEAWENRDD